MTKSKKFYHHPDDFVARTGKRIKWSASFLCIEWLKKFGLLTETSRLRAYVLHASTDRPARGRNVQWVSIVRQDSRIRYSDGYSVRPVYAPMQKFLEPFLGSDYSAKLFFWVTKRRA